MADSRCMAETNGIVKQLCSKVKSIAGDEVFGTRLQE